MQGGAGHFFSSPEVVGVKCISLQSSQGKGHPRIGHDGPEGSRGIALLLNLGARWEWVVNATLWPLYPGKDPVSVVQEAGWVPGPVWTGTENLAPTGIRSLSVQPVASRRTDGAIPAHSSMQCLCEE